MAKRALDLYTQPSVEQSSDNDTIKELILKAYELVLEAYRQKFRNCIKENHQPHVEFARTKEQLYLIGGTLQRKLALIIQNLGSSCSLKNQQVHKF